MASAPPIRLCCCITEQLKRQGILGFANRQCNGDKYEISRPKMIERDMERNRRHRLWESARNSKFRSKDLHLRAGAGHTAAWWEGAVQVYEWQGFSGRCYSPVQFISWLVFRCLCAVPISQVLRIFRRASEILLHGLSSMSRPLPARIRSIPSHPFSACFARVSAHALSAVRRSSPPRPTRSASEAGPVPNLHGENLPGVSRAVRYAAQ